VQKFDSAFIKKNNRIKVLSLIRKKGLISRAELSRLTEISAPTITRITTELISEEGLVVDVGPSVSGGGRPPNMVRFAGETKFIIGIDIGSTHIRGALSNMDGNIILDKKEVPTHNIKSFEDIVETLIRLIDSLLEFSHVEKKNVLGVGLAYGGLFNEHTHKVEFIQTLHWSNSQAAAILKERIGLPVKIDNVTRVVAIGELHFGIGKKYDNFICINVGYGIGAGIIVESKPFYGKNSLAGEFGHIVISKDDERLCNCGNYGCIEAICSGSGMVRTAINLIKRGRTSVLNEYCSGHLDDISAEMIIRAVQQGDNLASEILDEAIEYLALGIMNLVNLFDPSAIVLHGRIAVLGDLVVEPIRKVIKEKAYNIEKKSIEIEFASFGNESPMIGAIALILENVMTLEL
jgi:glucokinase-like ROK family protein